jgi:hypothetical protein
VHTHMQGHTAAVRAAAFAAADPTTFATAGDDASICIWSLKVLPIPCSMAWHGMNSCVVMRVHWNVLFNVRCSPCSASGPMMEG